MPPVFKGPILTTGYHTISTGVSIRENKKEGSTTTIYHLPDGMSLEITYYRSNGRYFQTVVIRNAVGVLVCFTAPYDHSLGIENEEDVEKTPPYA